MAGPDLVGWELTAVGPNGPYRLAIHHAQGSIVEYFDDVTAALLRQGELEELLVAARAEPGAPSESSWVDVESGQAKPAAADRGPAAVAPRGHARHG